MFEDIILQLKILGKIQKNGRICKSPDGQGISIEERSTLLWLQRLWNGDSRADAIERINKIIQNASEKTKDIMRRSCMTQRSETQRSETRRIVKSSEQFDDPQRSETRRIVKSSEQFDNPQRSPQDERDYTRSILELTTLTIEYRKAQKGIQNLTETYKNDSRAEAKLSLCISRIEEEVVNIENTLKGVRRTSDTSQEEQDEEEE